MFNEYIDICFNYLNRIFGKDGYKVDHYKVKEQTSVNDNGDLCDETIVDLYVHPKKQVEFIEIDITVTKDGIK